MGCPTRPREQSNGASEPRAYQGSDTIDTMNDISITMTILIIGTIRYLPVC